MCTTHHPDAKPAVDDGSKHDSLSWQNQPAPGVKKTFDFHPHILIGGPFPRIPKQHPQFKWPPSCPHHPLPHTPTTMEKDFGTQTTSLTEWYEGLFGKVSRSSQDSENASDCSDSGEYGESEYGDDAQTLSDTNSDRDQSECESLPPDSSDDGESDFGDTVPLQPRK